MSLNSWTVGQALKRKGVKKEMKFSYFTFIWGRYLEEIWFREKDTSRNPFRNQSILCCNKRCKDIWNEYLLITASLFTYFISHWASAGHFLRDSLSHLMINHYVLLQLQLEDPWEPCNEFESQIPVEHKFGIDSII